MNLHDWIDELCDALDIDAEADEGLLVDLAAIVRENVHPAAGPVTSFLLGYAAAEQGADPDAVEILAAKAQALAESWDRPAGAASEVDDDVDVDELTDADYDAVDREDAADREDAEADSLV